MFRRKKKSVAEQGSGYFVDENAPSENKTITQGTGATLEDPPTNQFNSSGEPSGFYIKSTDIKKKDDEDLIL